LKFGLVLGGDERGFSLSEIENSADGPAYDDYRVADYAFLYISLIQRRPYQFQPKPDDRDKAIGAFKRQLIAEMKAKD
jgi:hypothetical protein